MNTKIKCLKEFINQYRRLDSYWKSLLEDSYTHCQNKLMMEYELLSNHPYPKERLDMQKTINRYEKHIKL